ncbi:MAG: TIGR01777 family oxidoreductase [Actinobacteria bacterium]|nr:TIGR01777 family oxidoreductase [Actinomycetota bacterium]
MALRVLVSGSSGLIGSAVVDALLAEGHEVVRLVRRPPATGEVQWHPQAGNIDAGDLVGVEAVVHLAGEPIGAKRWSASQKQRILDSRVKGTRLLAETLARLEPRPRVFVSGSAIGYYGLRGDEILTERSSAGSGFLADVTVQWEAATLAAEQAQIRTVHLRTGIVLSARGGAMGRLLPLFKLGLGGRLGRGDQWWSWITLADEVGIILHALREDSLAGPVNATAPNPATNREFTRALATVLRRPAVLPVPRAVLALVMGAELTDQVIVAGQRVLPDVVQDSGYRFVSPDLEAGLRRVLEPA